LNLKSAQLLPLPDVEDLFKCGWEGDEGRALDVEEVDFVVALIMG